MKGAADFYHEESISESLQKPLYNVNGGELGTSAATIQRGLERAFGLVARWDAIFLLDEADAFLARRGDNVERNAPISGESPTTYSPASLSRLRPVFPRAIGLTISARANTIMKYS